MNLTDLKLAPDGAVLKDDEVAGLEFRKRGDKGSFLLYYRNKAGERRRPKLGDWPGLTLKQARDVAREWLGEVARGKDPSQERTALRRSVTVAELCSAWLKTREGRPSYRHEKGYIDRIVVPAWGARKALTIGKQDVMDLKAAYRSKPVTFNRALAAISGAWKFADMPAPTVGVAKYRERPRQRYLTLDEAGRLKAALDQLRNEYPYQVALISLLAVTGARFSEIARAKRSWYEGRVLTLERHKTAAASHNKSIVFSALADEIVRGVDPRDGWLVGTCSYPNAAWAKARTIAGLKNFTLHDLRHSFASEALANGYTLAQIGEVFGHKDPATTKRYAHLLTDGKRLIAETVSKTWQ